MPDVLDAVRRFQADQPAPSDAAVERAEARLRAEIAGKPPRRRRRRRIALAIIPVALVAVGAGAVLHEPARVDAGPACGNEATISPQATTVLSPDAGDLVTACAALWRKGVVSGERVRRADMPELTACVAPTGVVIVLPGGGPGFCERAGGGDLPAGYRERRERFAALFSALGARFSEGDGSAVNPNFECVTDFESARAIVERILREHGFSDWRGRGEPRAVRPGPSLRDPRLRRATQDGDGGPDLAEIRFSQLAGLVFQHPSGHRGVAGAESGEVADAEAAV